MDINLFTWHTNRCLEFCPKHFIWVKIPLSEDAKLWITDRLSGRYYIGSYPSVDPDSVNLWLETSTYVSFEDPQEAVLFQLAWS